MHGQFFKSIIRDFWSTAQDHSAQILEHNSLMPSYLYGQHHLKSVALSQFISS